MIQLPPRPTPERMQPLGNSEMTDAQRAAAQELVSGPRGTLQGPFIPMMRSPNFMRRAQKVGEFIRYESVLADDLRELAILATAVHWQQPVEWAIHAPIAVRAGVPEAALTELVEKADMQSLSETGQAVVAFCRQLHETQDVDDQLYVHTLALLGEEGLVDLIGICGYYTMLAMVMNVSRTLVRD